MGLKEILAAKKAAAAAASGEPEQQLPPKEEEKKVEEPSKPMSTLEAMNFSIPETSSVQETETVMPAENTERRKETFSEMMARKKKEKELANSQTIVSENGIVESEPEEIEKAPINIELSEEQKEVLQEIESESEAQAYTDIVLKINALRYSATGTDLSKAMDTLTAALHKNPSASMLLLDPDIGQMTIAIRRLVGDELAETKAGKKDKKSKANKQIELTPERLAKQFDIPDDM